MDDDRGRLEILMEQQAARMDAVLEFVSDLPAMRDTLREHSEDLRELKADVKDIKQIVRGHAEAITELRAANR